MQFLVSLGPNYFIFIGYLKMGAGRGIRANNCNKFQFSRANKKVVIISDSDMLLDQSKLPPGKSTGKL